MTTTNKPKNLIRIAIAASRGIGDGLITLVLANNLVRNNFDITVFSNPLAQLNHWFPTINILPYPNPMELNATFEKFDLIMSDAYSELTKNFPRATKQFVIFCMTHFDDILVEDQSEQLTQRIQDKEKLKKLLPIAQSTGTVINRLDHDAPMIDRMAIFCRAILKLENVTRDNGMTPLNHLTYKKHPKRIIIHPTSSNSVKNWPPYKFIALAKKLKNIGFEPAFTVSPAEYETWKQLTHDEFLLPSFPNLSDLAKYIYESGFLIGTDSGLGHIASNLGISTVTICRTGNKHFRWRPAWAPGKVVKTRYKLRFACKQHWHWLISVNQVFKAFRRLESRSVIQEQ